MGKLKIKSINLGKDISIEIDGKEVPRVVALDLRIRVDEIPTVVIRQAIVDKDMSKTVDVKLNNVNVEIEDYDKETDTKIDEIVKGPVEEAEVMK